MSVKRSKVFVPLAIAVVGAGAGAAGCAEPRPPPAEMSSYCPTISEETRDAFVVHGAKVFDGETIRDPADVLVAGGEIVAVGPTICFRARASSVSFVDGAGATLSARVADDDAGASPRRRITPGDPADLVLVDASGNTRATWRRGVLAR